MNNFEICSNGDIFPLEFDKEQLNLEETDLNFDHLLVYNFNENLNLVIDTFNDIVALLDKNIVSKLINSPSSLNKEDLFNFGNKFLGPKSNKCIERLKNRYLEDMNIRKSNVYTFIICPTYSCNMRCIYCYQQGNDDLNKKIICEENLIEIFNYIKNEEQKIKKQHKNNDYKIFIELFGGEPIQTCNRDVLQKIFEFARENKYFVIVTTNGVEIDKFYDLFLTYNGYIGAINTTIDGTREYHNSRRIYKKGIGSFDRILKNIEFLLDLNIIVTLSINIDEDNINQLKEIIDVFEQNQWLSNKYFELQIGRVDDRLFETNYKGIISESQLLEYICNLNLDYKNKNIRAAFLKSLFYIAKKFDISVNQNEYGRSLFHYCWSSSPGSYIKYIDANLNLYRCTYSVGREELSIGRLNEFKDDLGYFKDHNLFNLPKCLDCKIGGYCSGGCKLSSIKDEEQQCKYELNNFNDCIENIIIPHLKEKFKYINQYQCIEI